MRTAIQYTVAGLALAACAAWVLWLLARDWVMGVDL